MVSSGPSGSKNQYEAREHSCKANLLNYLSRDVMEAFSVVPIYQENIVTT